MKGKKLFGVLAILLAVTVAFSGIGCGEEEKNQSPVANSDWAETTMDTAVVIDVTANDTDADGTIDVTTVTIVANPDDGTVSVNSATGKVTYTPDSGFAGTDTFTYRVKDNDGANSNSATVIVTIPVPGNVAPVAADDQATTTEDTSVVIDVCANDTDADGTIDVTSVGIVVGPAHGSASVSATTGKVTYNPDSGFSGTDTFTYRVTDDSGGLSNVATVTVTVTEVKTQREQTLIVAVASLAEAWFNDISTFSDNFGMASCLEYLLNMEPGTSGDYEPGLATSWEMSEDGSTWTFNLREGVKWHPGPDGEDYGVFTADDVIYNVEIGARVGANTADDVWRDFVDWVEEVDPYTVVFHMKEGEESWELHTSLTNAAPHLPMHCKAYALDYGEAYAATHPIGTGPYKFVSMTPGSVVEFEAVDEHWRQAPYYKYLKLINVPEEATRMAMLMAGDVDITDMTPLSVYTVAGVEGFAAVEAPNVVEYDIYYGGMYVAPNTPGTSPWVGGPGDEDAKKVRQAMAMAINRQEIVDYVFYGKATADCPIAGYEPGLPWTDPSWTVYPYDPAGAIALLAEAGYEDGFSLSLDTYVTSGRVMAPDIAEAVASYWEAIGLDVSINELDYGSFMGKWATKKTYDMYTYSWNRPYEPGKRMQYTFVTAAWSPVPIVQWNAELDGYVGTGVGDLDAETRHEALRNAGQIIYDNYLTIPIVFAHSLYGVNSDKVGTWVLPAYPAPMYCEDITP
ncbi:MAG: tandem-95 repeat protein [Dehalococcoidia bacterium]|nr:MAG: tandem-95 repeat protein [Dehalococcoidia bacterium]